VDNNPDAIRILVLQSAAEEVAAAAAAAGLLQIVADENVSPKDGWDRFLPLGRPAEY
jgi:hypothetical protein